MEPSNSANGYRFSVIEHLHQKCSTEPHTAVAYFYCHGNQKQSSTAVLGSFLRQLYPKWSNLVDAQDLEFLLNVYYNHRQKKHRSSVFQNLFKSQAAPFSTIFLILDGLDETVDSDRKDILSHVRSLLELQNVKLLVFSRPTFDAPGLETHDLKLNIEMTSVYEDIRTYLAWRFVEDEKLRTIGSPLREKIARTLLDKSAGM